MKRHRRILIKDDATRRLAAGLITALVLISCLPATVAAAEPPLTAVERAAHFEEALLRAKATGKDIVVLQRSSDWNRLGEMLYQDVWLKDEFARALRDRFILVTVDLPEQEGAQALPGPFSPADGALTDRVKPVPVPTPSRRIATLVGGETPLPANEVTVVESPGGAIFKQRTDGAWVAEGPNPAHDILTLKLKTAGGGQVLRLDFPTDPSQPGGGPGRAGNGNFVLTEVEVQSGATPMKLMAAWSNTGSGDAGVAIDGISDQNDKHWSGDGHHHVRRTMLLAMPEPLAAEAGLTVRLFCRSPWGYHMPGCLRAAVLPDPGLREDLVQALEVLKWNAKNNGYTWWDTTYCPRVALLDSEGRAVACENKPRRDLTPASMAARVKELRAVREKRDALWARAESERGPEQAELLRQSLDVMGFANWAGNANCYQPIHDKIQNTRFRTGEKASPAKNFVATPSHTEGGRHRVKRHDLNSRRQSCLAWRRPFQSSSSSPGPPRPVAAEGATTPGAAVRRTATGSCRGTATGTSASAPPSLRFRLDDYTASPLLSCLGYGLWRYKQHVTWGRWCGRTSGTRLPSRPEQIQGTR